MKRRRSPLEEFELVSIYGSYMGRTNISRIRRRRRVVGYMSIKRRFKTRRPNKRRRRLEERVGIRRGRLKQSGGKEREKYGPIIYVRFRFIRESNRRGLIPYSYSITSQIVICIMRSFMIWIGNRIIGIKKHGIKRRGRFLPTGSPRFLYPLRIPLERLSFVVRLLSLSVRLFANILSGHVLMKVILGFSWTILNTSRRGYRIHFVPRRVLFILFRLERGVGFIQAYVFVLLSCIYRSDIVKGGH